MRSKRKARENAVSYLLGSINTVQAILDSKAEDEVTWETLYKFKFELLEDLRVSYGIVKE